MTRFEPLIGPTFSSAARSWVSCPSRHAQRLLVLPCQTTPGTATPSNLPGRHCLCRSGVMDTGAHFLIVVIFVKDVRGEGDVVGVVAPLGGVAQVIFHGSPGCRGRVCAGQSASGQRSGRRRGKDKSK